jgi:hypothetical protein
LEDLSTASAAVKLFAQWCEKAPVDAAWRGRFKVMLIMVVIIVIIEMVMMMMMMIDDSDDHDDYVDSDDYDNHPSFIIYYDHHHYHIYIFIYHIYPSRSSILVQILMNSECHQSSQVIMPNQS